MFNAYSMCAPCVFPVCSLCFPCMLPVFSLCAPIKHFFIPKTKVAQNYAKRMLVEPILCFAYIFGELGVTIAFWRLSWFQANFHDIKHPFHNKKHFFIPKSTKNKSCSKLCKTDVGRTNFVFRVYFWRIGSFPFQNGYSGSVYQNNSILETFMISSKFSWHEAPFS